MTDYVNEWLASQKAGKTVYAAAVVRRATCADGTKLSIQASEGHYCNPRSDTGPWTSVEVWQVTGPSGRAIYPRSFGSGGKDQPYGWAPVEAVNRFIKRHGGLA